MLAEPVPQLAQSYWCADRSVPVLEQTIGDALHSAATAWGERTALIEGRLGIDPRRRWSFASLLEQAQQVARALLGRFPPGDRVAVWAANSPEWLLIEFGAAIAGITLVTANPAYLGSELAYVLKQSKASGIFVQPEYRGRDLLAAVEEIRLPRLREVISLSSWSGFVASGSLAQALPKVHPGDIAQIQYTSGTTGFPKGAQLTHRGLVNNARFYARAIGAGPEDVWVNPMPLFHTAGCGLATLGALQTGGPHILPPGFDPALMLGLIETEHGTLTLNVPTMLLRILDAAAVSNRNLASWRLTMLGGAPVAPELVRRAQQELGLKVAIGFGQTEASPYITHTVPDDPHPDWVSTVGRPLPQTEVKVINPATGDTLPLDTTGEICARGYGVMMGYFDNPAATAIALDTNGWLHTGDLGSMDRYGYCKIQGRLKDMIIRGGENIYPREIEDVLFTHPDVADVSVLGIPDQEWGEIVAAFIQPRPGSLPLEEELAAFCRQHLSSYKIPRLWRFVDEFPQTASGKIQKFILRDRFLTLER